MGLCRLCLGDIRTPEYVLISKPNLIQIIKECIGLEINISNDAHYYFPNWVCKKCMEKLKELQKFKALCLKNDLLLKRGVDHFQNGQINATDEISNVPNESKIETNPVRNALPELVELNQLQLNNTNARKKEQQTNLSNDSEEVIQEGKLENINEKTENELSEEVHLKHEVIEDESHIHECTDINPESEDLDCVIKSEEIYFNEISTDPEILNYTYSCEYCQEEFDMFLEYLEHQDEHEGQNIFKCDKCNEVFQYKKDLAEHENGHKVACDLCGVFLLSKSLRSHLVLHTDRFKCTECSYTFASKLILEKHVIAVHTTIRDHVCELCGKSFSTSTSLRIHKQSHGERTYKCKVCDFAGKTSTSLLLHNSKHLRETHVCEMCSKIFKSYRNLYDHLRRVHKAEKKHVCTWNDCTMRFIDKYMLRTHMRIHTGNRPYACTQCDKKFTRSDSLKEHVQTHNRTTSYKCATCDKKFITNRGKARHNCHGPPKSDS